MSASPAEKYAKIAALVSDVEPHRNAERREAWRQIVGIVNDEQVAPRVDEPEVAEPVSDGGGEEIEEPTDEAATPTRRTRTPKD